MASLFDICCHSRLRELSISDIQDIPLEIFNSIDATELSLPGISTLPLAVPTALNFISLLNVTTLIINDTYTGIEASIDLEHRPKIVMPKMTDIICDIPLTAGSDI